MSGVSHFTHQEESTTVAEYVAYAILTCLAWEIVINLSFDVHYLWASATSLVKLIYFSSKYIGFLSQIGGLYIKYRVQLLYDGSSPTIPCQKWLASQLVTLFLLVLNLEVLLMTRLYALHGRSKHVGWALGILAAIKSAACIVLLALVIVGARYGECCSPKSLPRIAVAFCFVDIVTHTAIFGLTIAKCLSLSGEERWWSIALLRMVVRDTFTIFLALVVLRAMMVLDIWHHGEFARIVIPMSVGTSSIATCRIIMTMRTFTVPQSSSELRIELTSITNTGPSLVVT